MTRKGLQKLARAKLREGRILLRARAYDGAYYLMGFSVELALKACIARKTERYDFPDKPTVDRSWRHELRILASVAGLTQVIDAEYKANRDFAANWSVVLSWTNESRYETHAAKDAEDLYKAITDPGNGVLACIKRIW